MKKVTEMIDNFYYSDAHEIVKMCFVGLLILAFIVGMGVMLVKAEQSKVDAIVVSCEQTDDYVNHGAKTMGTFYTAQGKFTQGMAFNAMSQPQDRYIVVAEYNGEQFEIETSKPYEVGEVIRVHPPK